MRPFEILDKATLIDALARYTERYTKIISEGGKRQDMVNCQETIDSLIAEIELRKASERKESPVITKRVK